MATYTVRLPAVLLGCLACGLSGAEGTAATVHPSRPVGHYASLDALPDWGGVWVLDRRRSSTATPEPALKGEYLRRYRAWQQEARENDGVVRRGTSNCMPPGMPAMMGSGQYPMEFLFTPGKVTTRHEAWMQWRTIYTDGRSHPEDLEPGIFGHSIGRWEGDTLVVETIGIKTITTIQHGIHHSPLLKVTERFRLSPDDPDTLLLDQRLEDPEALEQPWDRQFVYRRQRDWDLMEFVCAENDRNPVGPDGHTRFE
jgi:hypothetical protein